MNFITYLNKVDSMMVDKTGSTASEEMMGDIEKAMDCGMDVEECVASLIKSFILTSNN